MQFLHTPVQSDSLFRGLHFEAQIRLRADSPMHATAGKQTQKLISFSRLPRPGWKAHKLLPQGCSEYCKGAGKLERVPHMTLITCIVLNMSTQFLMQP